MASVDVDVIPGAWLQVGRSGGVSACNRAARETFGGIKDAVSWADWLGEADLGRLPLELAGLPIGSLWQGELALRASGSRRARILVLEDGFSVLLGPSGEQADVVPWGEFLGRFCHDARAPVAAVKSSLFLLDRHGQAVQGEREQKWLAAASQSLAGLEVLVRAVGALGEWTGAPRVARPVEVADLGRALADLVGSTAGAGGPGRLEIDWGPEVPLRWSVNPDAWLAALEPLLLNALRHAPAGDVVRVRASLVPDGLGVEVSDGGPGVAANEEQFLFRPFFHSRHDAARGVGLGLAKARAAARACGGEVSYRREAGRTVFTLRVGAKPAVG